MMRSLLDTFWTGLRLLRRGFVWWFESFGRLPGVTRDLSLPTAPTLHESDAAAAELAEATRRLADEMHWGTTLHPDGPDAPTRVRM